jgi:hypothetical protein
MVRGLVTDFATRMSFRRSGSELFDTFTNIILVYSLLTLYGHRAAIGHG